MKVKLIKKICSSILLSFMVIAFIGNAIQCLTEPEPVDIITIPKTLPGSDVAVVRSEKDHVNKMQYEDILKITRQAKDLIKNNHTVVLKPNLVTIIDYTIGGWLGKPLAPEANGTTTDWRIVKAVVQLVREVNPDGKVYVMEGSSISTKKAFEHHKYTHENIPGVDAFLALEEDSGGWQETTSDKLIKVDLPKGIYRTTYYLNRIYKEADVLINLPCLKNHWNAVISGAVLTVPAW